MGWMTGATIADIAFMVNAVAANSEADVYGFFLVGFESGNNA